MLPLNDSPFSYNLYYLREIRWPHFKWQSFDVMLLLLLLPLTARSRFIYIFSCFLFAEKKREFFCMHIIQLCCTTDDLENYILRIIYVCLCLLFFGEIYLRSLLFVCVAVWVNVCKQFVTLCMLSFYNSRSTSFSRLSIHQMIFTVVGNFFFFFQLTFSLVLLFVH